MLKKSRRLALLISGLLILSLWLVACGGENTPAPVNSSPSPAPATTSVATTAAATANAGGNGADAAATATPVVLASLPPAPTSAPTTARAIAPTASSGQLTTGATPTPFGGSSGVLNPPTTVTPVPLPSISPAPVSAFGLKSISSLGLDQKTIIQLLNLITPIGPIPPTTQPGTLQGIALVASTWKMAPPLVWCEDTADKLKTVWAALNFSMTLDNQPVDLKPYQTKDFDDSGTPCKAIDLGLSSTPTGTHLLTVTRKVLQAVATGTQSQKLSPGDYTYQIVLYSVAPKPNGTSTATLPDFGIGSSRGSNPIYSTPGPPFALYSDTIEQYKPGTFKYTAALLADEQYGLVGGWCAKDQATLDENWKKMTYTATINGQNVDLSNVPTYDSRQLNGQFCRSWDLSMTPPEGQHNIVIKLNFKADTNDGIGTYAAGDYISDYTVLSVKPTF